jgi:hypothetical protein
VVIGQVLSRFKQGGLVRADADGGFRYAPRSRELDAVVGALLDEYERRPVGVMEEIYIANRPL